MSARRAGRGAAFSAPGLAKPGAGAYLPAMFCDIDLCRRCGACVAECPFEVVVPDGEGFPALRRAARKMCIGCGHCVAVCPVGALTLPEMPVTPEVGPGHCPPVPGGARPDPARAELFLASRRSVRTYRPEPLDRATLEHLLAVAAHAPSAHNRQPVRWIVSFSPGRTRALAGLVVEHMAARGLFPGLRRHWAAGEDRVLRGAPHVAVATAPLDGLNPAEDCCAAAAYLELAAHARGLGACWAGFLMEAAREYPPLAAALGVAPGHGVFAAIILGKARFRYRRVPPRRAPRVDWLE
jgi:nitroreductase/NAD-dependent dihydropyrimidine dehydrogenase PreA subunit